MLIQIYNIDIPPAAASPPAKACLEGAAAEPQSPSDSAAGCGVR